MYKCIAHRTTIFHCHTRNCLLHFHIMNMFVRVWTFSCTFNFSPHLIPADLISACPPKMKLPNLESKVFKQITKIRLSYDVFYFLILHSSSCLSYSISFVIQTSCLSLSQLISPVLFFYLILLQMKTWEFRVKSSLISERRLKRLFSFFCLFVLPRGIVV